MLKTIQGKVNTLVDYARLAHDINGYRVYSLTSPASPSQAAGWDVIVIAGILLRAG